jgi:glycerophosphoryl diester phosphodiesterase
VQKINDRPTTLKVFAHRGGRKTTPENSMAAFENSLHLGVHAIELDVQRCATGELVVIHDERINRTTNGVGLVKDISLAELRKISNGKWFAKEFEDQHVPALLEVLDLVAGNVIVNIEVKNAPVNYPGIEEDLLEVISHYKYPERLVISSFDHKVLLHLSHESELQLALLADCAFYDLPAYATAVGATCWHPSVDSVRPDLVEEAHEAGLVVNVWTVNEERQWRSLIEMGVDGIVTDDPAGLMEYLDQLALASDSVC